MNVNAFDKLRLRGMIPNNILIKEGNFTLSGLNIRHNGRGRVVITDLSGSTMYSDSDYYSTSEVEGIINNILETRPWKRT